MELEKEKNEIVNRLLAWYDENHRELPWRSDPTPYHVWVSEIMLQQTRVEAVRQYYERFLTALPDIASLAAASEEKLLKLWEGLGYYNRVRNMQAAAQTIVKQHMGEFPDRYEQILQLKGIGEYTAGAIASIAFQEAVPAVDGNVLRVFSRLVASRLNISKAATKKWITQEIAGMLPVDRPGAFNQAWMDLGAMVCIPNGSPHCEICPWESFCLAKRNNLQQEIPVKEKPAARRKEKKTVFLLFSQGKVAITKRPATGLLAGLWQYPLAKELLSLKEAKACVEQELACDVTVTTGGNAKHIFSHIEWQMKGICVQIKKIPDKTTLLGQDLIWVTGKQLQSVYSVPSAFDGYRQLVQSVLAGDSR